MICKKCNAEMIYFEECLSCGWNCPNCGDALVTTNFNSIQMDKQIYSIILSPCPKASTEDYKVVAKICNLSLINAKKLIECGGVIVEGRATKIVESYSLLKGTKLVFKISPEFPYLD